MAEFIKLPVGIENFEKIRRDGFYYVDKTGHINQFKRGKCRQLRECTQPAETDCNGRSENAPDCHEWKQVR